MEEEREATVMKDDGKAIDSATVAMNKVEQREAEESKVPQKTGQVGTNQTLLFAPN